MQIDPRTGASSLFYQGTKTVVGPVGIVLNPAKDIVWLGDYGPANTQGVYDGADSNVDVILPTGKLVATFDNATTGTNSFDGVWGQGVSDVNGHIDFYWPNAGTSSTGVGGGEVWRIDPLSGISNQPLGSTYTLLARGLGATTAPGTNASDAGGPQGLVYDPATGTLYVTDDVTNEIIGIPDAASATGPATPEVIASGGRLDSPQGIALNPPTATSSWSTAQATTISSSTRRAGSWSPTETCCPAKPPAPSSA